MLNIALRALDIMVGTDKSLFFSASILLGKPSAALLHSAEQTHAREQAAQQSALCLSRHMSLRCHAESSSPQLLG